MNVLVIAKTDRLALNVIRCLRMSRMSAHLMCLENPLGARHSRYCSTWVKPSGDIFAAPHTGAAEEINGYCRKRGINVVMAVDMPAVLMLATIQAEIKPARAFPLAGPDLLRMLDNKWSFANFLREQQLPLPETVLIESAEQLEGINLTYPLVAKPLQLEDGIGIRKLNSPAEARGHLWKKHESNQLPLLFQEFIPGTDVDLSILADNGRVTAWTIQRWLPDGRLKFVDDGTILYLGRKIAAATKFHGVAHFDLRLDERDGRVKFLECNPRFWATLRESMWNGTNFVELGIQLCAGRRPTGATANREIAYTFPSRMMGSILSRDLFTGKRIPVESLRDAWQTISDPLTLACKIQERWRRRSREP